MVYIHHQCDVFSLVCPFLFDYVLDVVAIYYGKERERGERVRIKAYNKILTLLNVISAVSLSVHKKNSSGLRIPILSQIVLVISATVELSST